MYYTLYNITVHQVGHLPRDVNTVCIPLYWVALLADYKIQTNKHTFYELIFQFITSSTCFEPEASSSESRFYLGLWYSMYFHASD